MKQSKPIFVVSDLHLGSGGRRDNFAKFQKEKQFFEFLSFVEKNNGELIITGDLVDMWRFRIKRIMKRYCQLFDRLSEMNVTYIAGNHDQMIVPLVESGLVPHKLFERITAPFTRQIGGKCFVFMHGHEFDPINRRMNPLWGRIVCVSTGAFEWINGSYFHSAQEIEKALGIKNLRTKKLLKRYAKFKKIKDYDTLITAHTHRVGSYKNWYFNSGSWLGKTNNFLQILPDGGTTVFDWTTEGPQRNQTLLCA